MTEHRITIVSNRSGTRYLWKCGCGEQGKRFVLFRGNAAQEGNIHKGAK